MKRINESMEKVIDNGDFNPLEHGETPESLEKYYQDPDNGVEVYKDYQNLMDALVDVLDEREGTHYVYCNYDTGEMVVKWQHYFGGQVMKVTFQNVDDANIQNESTSKGRRFTKTLKKLNLTKKSFNESTNDMAELKKYLDDFADATFEAANTDFDNPMKCKSVESTMSKVIDYVKGLGLNYDRAASINLEDVYYAAINFASKPENDEYRQVLDASKVLFIDLIKQSLEIEED